MAAKVKFGLRLNIQAEMEGTRFFGERIIHRYS